MEIYHLRARWLGFIFFAPVVWFVLSLAGHTSFEIKGDEKVASYIVIAICLIVSLQCFLGSTRFYFDNNSRNGVQIRRHFYGKNVVYIPYSDIIAIAVQSYRRGKNTHIVYRVGLIEKTTFFGKAAEKFTPLRSYSGKEDSLPNAKEFGQKVCSYTQLNFIDNSEIVMRDFVTRR